jgi:hypothetical protein
MGILGGGEKFLLPSSSPNTRDTIVPLVWTKYDALVEFSTLEVALNMPSMFVVLCNQKNDIIQGQASLAKIMSLVGRPAWPKLCHFGGRIAWPK